MGGGTLSHKNRTDAERQRVTYARRRFGVFVAGLATLAVVTFGFARALGGGPPPAGGVTALGDSTGQTYGLASPSPQPAVAANPDPSAAPDGSAPGSRAGSPAASAGSATPTAPVSSFPAASQLNRCSREYVVLSLFTSQNGPHATPQFDVDVVSTQMQPCKFNVGGWHLALVIKKGTARIWSSASCAAGPGSLIIELRRGVPTVLPISWDRQRAAQECTSPPSRATAGTYSATATDDGLTSNTETFRLR
jgi:hypothetical protein